MLLLGGFILVGIAAYYFWPGQQLPANTTIDRIEIYKSRRKMQVFSGEKLLKTYTVALGRNPIGAKQFEGDNKTPEGLYVINERNPNSSFHKNLGVSYPNAKDLAFAEKSGKPAGGLIKIHGLRNGRGFIGKFHRWKDWTRGCIAVTNSEIDELYKAVQPDAIITIHP